MFSPIEEIKNKLDIVDVIGGYVKLEKAGISYRARCPFHNEKTPSFFVSPSRQIWRCFGGCSEGGDMFKFVMKIEGMEFLDALRLLADKAGVRLKKQDPKLVSERSKLYDINEEAAQFFEKNLSDKESGKYVKEYLKKRGLAEKGIKEFRLGYSLDSWRSLFEHLAQLGYKPEDIEKAGLIIKKSLTANCQSLVAKFYDRFRNRIMFPIQDTNGRVVGFTGRIFENPDLLKSNTKVSVRAKYMNSPETLIYDKGRILYGLDKARFEMKKKNQCVLVEGNLDLIMSHQAGVRNAVATSGTALTTSQLRIIRRYTDNLAMAFDMDTGGENATKRAIELSQKQGFNVDVVRLDGAKDPAEYIEAYPEEWLKRIKEGVSIYKFYIEYILSGVDLKDPISKKNAVSLILPIFKNIPNRIEQAHWVAELARRLHVSEEDIRQELVKTKTTIYAPEEGELPETRQREKPRTELLEERLLFILMNHPKKLPLLKESGPPLSLLGKQVIKYLEQKKEGDFAPPDVKEILDYISLFSEYEKNQEIDYDDEFSYILNELKTVSIKEELKKLSYGIQEAEQAGDIKTAHKLLEKFNKISANL